MLYWLVCLGGVVLSSVCSQSALDAFIILIGLKWVSIVVREKSFSGKAQFNWLGVESAFALYFLIVCLSYYVNRSAHPEWSQGLAKFMWVVHLYLFVFALQQVKFEQHKLIKYFATVFLLPTLYSLASYVNGTDLITGRANNRITGLVNSATYHAHGNAMIFVFFAALIFFGRKYLPNKWRLITYISFGLLGLSIFLTFTRGIWLSIFFSSLFMLAIYNIRLSLKMFAVSCVMLFLVYETYTPFQKRVDTLFMADGGDPQRTDLVKVNWQMWQEHLWLGIGYGENIRRNREYWDRPEWNRVPGYIESHAHNQALNVLSTTGILGFIPFFLFNLFFFVKNWKLLRKTKRVLSPNRYTMLFACLWVQVEFALACLTDVGFEYAKIRILILVTWALVVAIERKPEIILEEKSLT